MHQGEWGFIDGSYERTITMQLLTESATRVGGILNTGYDNFLENSCPLLSRTAGSARVPLCWRLTSPRDYKTAHPHMPVSSYSC